jgi:hypothetical protein
MIFPNTFRRFRFLNATSEQIDAVDVYYATQRDPITNQWQWIPAMNPIAGVPAFRGAVVETMVPNNTPVKAVRVAVTKAGVTPLAQEACEQICVYEAIAGTYVGEALFLFENDATGASAYRVTLEVASLHTNAADDWHYTGHEHFWPDATYQARAAARGKQVKKSGDASKGADAPDAAAAAKSAPQARH